MKTHWYFKDVVTESKGGRITITFHLSGIGICYLILKSLFTKKLQGKNQ